MSPRAYMILITDIIKDMKKGIPASDIKLPTPNELLKLQKKYHSRPDDSLYSDGERSTWNADEASIPGGNSIFSGSTVDSSMTSATSPSLASLNAPIQPPLDRHVEKPDQPTPGRLSKKSDQPILDGVTKTSNRPPTSGPSSKPVPTQSLPRSEPAYSSIYGGPVHNDRTIRWGKRVKFVMWVCVCVPTLFSFVSLTHLSMNC